MSPTTTTVQPPVYEKMQKISELSFAVFTFIGLEKKINLKADLGNIPIFFSYLKLLAALQIFEMLV